MKLKNWNSEETLKLWWNSITQIVMKLKNSYCDDTQTQIGMKNVMELKNTSCDTN